MIAHKRPDFQNTRDCRRDMEPVGETVWIGGEIDRVQVSLRIFGDELDPDAVSAMLGSLPTKSYRKGEVIPGIRANRTAPTGMWNLYGPEEGEGDLEEQISCLLDSVSSEPASWAALAPYRKNVFCGLYLAAWNRGCALSAGLMQRLAECGLDLDLDIYGSGEKDE
jgi:hypothetical protein